MLRSLVILIAIAAAYFLVKRMLSSPTKPPSQPRKQKDQATRIVRCEYCGLHVPEPEAVRHEGHVYCSDEHRRLGQK